MKHLILFASLIYIQNASALDFKTSRSSNGLGIRIGHIKLPKHFDADVLSGLKTTLLFNFILKQNETELQKENVTINIRYDLWDEFFTLSNKYNQKTKQQQYKSLKQLRAELQNLYFKDLFSKVVDKDMLVQLNMNVLLNPIHKEKVKHIKQWVTKSRITLPTDPSTGRSMGSYAPPQEDSLFKTLFNQVSKNTSFIGSWQISKTTPAFKIKDLDFEKQ